MTAGFAPDDIANWAFLAVAATYGLYRGIRRYFFPPAESKYGDPQTIRQMAKLDERIHELLTELRVQTDAARVVIGRFHNGLYFFDATPLQKMSFSYESVTGGADTIKETYKDIEVSRMSAIMDRMVAEPLLVHTDSLPETYSRSVLTSLNVVVFACVALYQSKYKIVGCLMIHWFNDPEVRPIAPLNKKWLEGRVHDTVQKIELLLSERLKVTGTVRQT